MPQRTRERKKGRSVRRSDEAAEGSRMQTTTIALDEEMHRQLRHLAVEEKTTFRELIRNAIADFLAQRGRK